MLVMGLERSCCRVPCTASSSALSQRRPTASLVGGNSGHQLRSFGSAGQWRVGLRPSVNSRRADRLAAAALPGNLGKLISKTEIPAFIPRDDFADQMVRWAYMEQADGAVQKFGLPIKVEEVFREDDGRLWGTNLSFLRNGESVTTLYCGFDDDVLLKSEWMGMDDLGFPVPEGNMSEVQGKHYEIRKICDLPVDEELRTTLKEFCKTLVTTINKYYAFGSVFVDDTT